MDRDFGQIAARIRSCTACYFRDPEITPLAPVGTQAPVAIMFLGENPSWEEHQAVPFDPSTVSGQSLDANYLRPLGLTRDQVWITDLFKCRYPKDVYHAKRQAEPRIQTTVVAACKRWLLEEIAFARPAVIVTLSDSQVYQRLRRAFALHTPSRFEVAAGMPHQIDLDGQTQCLFPMVHPDVARPLGMGDHRKRHAREKWAPIHASTHLPALSRLLRSSQSAR